MAKEGGWGWCVTVASFLVHFVVCGIGYSSGVFQLIFVSYFGKSRFETAWVGSLLLCCTALGGIPGLILCYWCSYRVTVIVGGLLAVVGFAASYLQNELYHVYLSVGIIAGTGFGMALTPSILVLETYFNEKRVVASSLAISGVSIGTALLPLFVHHLEIKFAWKGMALILAACSLNICVAGLTMRSKHTSTFYYERHLLRMFELSLCKSGAFLCLLLSNLLWSAGVSAIFIHLPDYALLTGMDRGEAIALIAVIGLSLLNSRSMFAVLTISARLDMVSTLLCTVGLTTIMTGLFTQLFEHRAGAIGYAIMFGLHSGYWSTFIASVADELIGEEYLAYGKGYLAVSVAIGLLLGAPLCGLVYDKTGNFDLVFYIAGGCLLLSSLIMMAMSLSRCHFQPNIPDWSDSNSSTSSLSRNENRPRLEIEPINVSTKGKLETANTKSC